MDKPDHDQTTPQAPQEPPAVPDQQVPDKQIYRWKDDGGALAPEPEPEPTRDEP